MNKLSSIIKYQLPDFIVDDYDLFAAFIQSYYKWMDEPGNPNNFISNMQSNLDIDLADDKFMESYLNELAFDFPKNNLIESQHLLRVMHDFYASKGSAQSFKFIFTVLYNSNIEVIHPREFIHRLSNGKYVSNDFAYISANNDYKLSIDNENLNASITGVTSGNNAIIDVITQDFINGNRVYKLDISSYDGSFTPGENIKLTIDTTVVDEIIYGVLNGFNIDNKGVEYKSGDSLTITSASGFGAIASINKVSKGGYSNINIVSGGAGYVVGDVTQVIKEVDNHGFGYSGIVHDVDGSGAITAIQIINPGFDYEKKTTLRIISTTGSGANIEITGESIGNILDIKLIESGFGYATLPLVSIETDRGVNGELTAAIEGIFNESPSYINSDDWASDYNRLLDSDYYQQYSYAIKSDVSPHLWLDTVHKILHPAGSKLFGIYDLEFEVNIELSAPDRVGELIQHFFSIELESEVTSAIYTKSEVEKVINFSSLNPIGLTYSHLEDMKFQPGFTTPIIEFINLPINYSDEVPLNNTEDARITIT